MSQRLARAVGILAVSGALLAYGDMSQAQWRPPAGSGPPGYGAGPDWYDRYYPGYVDDYAGYPDYDDFGEFDFNYWDDYSGYADYDDFGWGADLGEAAPRDLDDFGFEDYEDPLWVQSYYEALENRPLYGYGPYERATQVGPPLRGRYLQQPRRDFGGDPGTGYERQQWH